LENIESGAQAGIDQRTAPPMKGFGQIGLKGYRPDKAAEEAAFFTDKAGGQIDKLKLIKLLYLTERESMTARARPMIYDEMYSLTHGPICSNALNGINGKLDKTLWSKWVKLDSNNKTVRLLKRVSRSKLDHLSDSDLKIMEQVWASFGHMTSAQIRKWTHDNCPEYTDVAEGSRVPIDYIEVFESVGHENAAELAQNVSQYRRVEAALES
jgi:uncharacterized phage-associated protein